MTSPTPSFLDFFVLEASEYVEQIDGLLARAAATGPDAEAMQRSARALRGSATMAKLSTFAELASAFEIVGRALRQGSLAFDAALKGAMVAAVDDMKILVRAARAWGAAEDQRAIARIGELSQYVPAIASATPTPSSASSAAYFAAEAANIAAGLDQLAARPDDKLAATNVLQRVRALRGVAGVKEIAALAEVAEAAESAIRPLELGKDMLDGDNVSVLRAAAELLRTIGSGVASGQSVTAATPQYRAFLSALDAMLVNVMGADRVIPIANLFYDDAGPHVVTTATSPPTTPAQRFRMEVVSLGEHLHRMIDEARQAADDITREFARSGLSRALRAIRATAASFGQMAVAQTVEGYLERTGDLNASALDAISGFAATISPAAIAPTPVAQASVPFRMTHARQAVAALGTKAPTVAPSPTAPLSSLSTQPTAQPMPALRPPAPPMPAKAAAAPAAPAKDPGAALDASIAMFDSFATERLAEPVPVGDDLVPVDALFYSGRSALDRAIELRDSLRKAGGTPSQDVLDEIYDLLDLARVG